MLRTLGEVAPDPAALPRLAGHARRAELALQVAGKVLPLYEAVHPHPHPRNLLELARRVLSTARDATELEKRAYSFIGATNDPHPIEEQRANFAARASACAAYVVVFDELITPDEGATLKQLENPDDPDLWDTAAWAAGAVAGFPWGAPFDRQKNYEFWSWYLTAVEGSEVLCRGVP